MVISVISPHTVKTGNTVSSILFSMGLTDLKKKVLLTHIKPVSMAFYQYLGLKGYEDKTTTPTQLVKLMRAGAIKPEDIRDYCKGVMDYLDVFTNDQANFSADDMHTLLDFLLDTDVYEYMVFDIDTDYKNSTAEMVIERSDLIILNLTSSFLDLELFNLQKEKIMKEFKGKKIILLCSDYTQKACKLKEITKKIGVKTTCYTIRHNSYVSWACNAGKMVEVFTKGKLKDARTIDLYKDAVSLATVVGKAKISLKRLFKR